MRRLILLLSATMTAVLGTLVANSPPAASASAHRTCTQSVKPGWKKPSGIEQTFSVIIGTDTCGRWIRAAERCKYPGAFGGFNYKWHVDKKPKRILGQKTSTYCGVLTAGSVEWGYQYYVKGSGRGHGWQLKELGHKRISGKKVLTAAITRHTARSVPTQVTKNGCHYSGKLLPLGIHTARVQLTKDSCGRDMRAWAYCYQAPPLKPFHARGEWRTSVGRVSHANCAKLDDGVKSAGYTYIWYKCVPNGVGTCTVLKQYGIHDLYP